MEEDLDAEIASLREQSKHFLISSPTSSPPNIQVHTQKNHHHYLTASLLSSTTIQHHLQTQTDTYEDSSPLAQTATTHAAANHHRIAFSTTSFRFTNQDPNAQPQEKSLLGLRIDLTARNGRYAKPYYVLLARVPEAITNGSANGSGSGKRVRVHRHTIPAFISIERLERTYLPRPQPRKPTDREDPLKPRKSARPRNQDLPGFVRALRREIVAWQRRRDAVGYLRGRLGLSRDEDDDSGDVEVLDRDARRAIDSLGIISLASTALETRYVRVEWEDGRVGRFKISDSGGVERAVVLGDSGRDKVVEGAITGGDGRVERVLERLMGLASSTAV